MITHQLNTASVLSHRAVFLKSVAMAPFDQIRDALVVEAARRKVIASQ